ncbi:hypothetical protein OG792_11725 [Micromonospora sp. NBC_01699]|uniref:alpha/beta hydrolase n=1 Tax=Micromonospora sp. NBC_01699 TaxID=2975984 RepID=UPI002E382321|nr:hypothetical protein [Micromonospora sp. NBC_01699]
MAGIDHAYESVAITFPGGRIAECLAGEPDPDGPTVAGDRAADVSFVLDRLIGSNSAWWGGRLIDRSRIAVAGHSVGGAAAVRSMLVDRRIRAGVNLDGAFQSTLDRDLDRPFLIIGARCPVPGAWCLVARAAADQPGLDRELAPVHRLEALAERGRHVTPPVV